MINEADSSKLIMQDTHKTLKTAFTNSWGSIPVWMKNSYVEVYDWLNTIPQGDATANKNGLFPNKPYVSGEHMHKLTLAIAVMQVKIKSTNTKTAYSETEFANTVNPAIEKDFKGFLAINGFTFGIDREPPIAHFDLNPELDKHSIPVILKTKTKTSTERINFPHDIPIGCARIRPHIESNMLQILRVGIRPDMRSNGIGGIMMDKLAQSIYDNPRNYIGISYDVNNPPIIYLDSRYGNEKEDRTDWYRRKGYIIAGNIPPINNHGLWNVRMYYVGDANNNTYNRYTHHIKELICNYTNSYKNQDLINKLTIDMINSWNGIKKQFENDRRLFISENFTH